MKHNKPEAQNQQAGSGLKTETGSGDQQSITGRSESANTRNKQANLKQEQQSIQQTAQR